MTLTTDPAALQITRLIDAPRERTYAAWTDPHLAGQWWGAAGRVTEELVLDAWRGGRFLWVLGTADGGRQTVRGKFHVVHPQEKIILTWQWADAEAWKDALSLVTVEFGATDASGRTELRLTHDHFPHPQSRDHHLSGWNQALDRLDHLLATAA